MAIPNVDDYIENESDCGCASSAPWKQKVVKIEDGEYFFDEGTDRCPYLVRYKINWDNFVSMGKNRYDNDSSVFIYSYGGEF